MKRLKYVSRWSEPLAREAIRELVDRAAAKNARLDITGILMTSGQLFFQVLEGPDSPVEALYREICADPRHQDVLLLNVEEDVTERIFPDWSMRKMDLDEATDERLQPLRDLLAELHERRLELDRLTLRLERSIWQELAQLAKDDHTFS